MITAAIGGAVGVLVVVGGSLLAVLALSSGPAATPTPSATVKVSPTVTATRRTPSPTPTVEVTAAPTQAFVTYTVQSGDNPATIAAQFPGVTRAQVVEANPGIKDWNNLQPGMLLNIPVPASAPPVVVPFPAAS